VFLIPILIFFKKKNFWVIIALFAILKCKCEKNCSFSNILQKVKSYFFANIFQSPCDSYWNSKKSIKLKPPSVWLYHAAYRILSIQYGCIMQRILILSVWLYYAAYPSVWLYHTAKPYLWLYLTNILCICLLCSISCSFYTTVLYLSKARIYNHRSETRSSFPPFIFIYISISSLTVIYLLNLPQLKVCHFLIMHLQKLHIFCIPIMVDCTSVLLYLPAVSCMTGLTALYEGYPVWRAALLGVRSC
jgi:hypothetical protein